MLESFAEVFSNIPAEENDLSRRRLRVIASWIGGQLEQRSAM